MRVLTYAIKSQWKARNAPSRGLWVPWTGSLWHKRAGVASLWKYLDQWKPGSISTTGWSRAKRTAWWSAGTASSYRAWPPDTPGTTAVWPATVRGTLWVRASSSESGSDLSAPSQISRQSSFPSTCRQKFSAESLPTLLPPSGGGPSTNFLCYIYVSQLTQIFMLTIEK